jgi:hypothetical protein
MTINKICFFNHYHNGDVFSGKGYMQDLINQLPDFEFYHAQNHTTKLVGDLKVTHVSIQQVPLSDHQRIAVVNDTLYINTWVGGAYNFRSPGEDHANYFTLYNMWMYIYQQTEQLIGRTLTVSQDIKDYIATTDWSKFEINPAMLWASANPKFVLFCNGFVRSGQSRIGLMEDIITTIAQICPDKMFVCAAKFPTDQPNIAFTDDIFQGIQGGDINEIAYLSTFAELIVGKNSGPYMYTHVKENVLNPNKAFLSLSHRPTDSYVAKVNGILCRYFHYNHEDPNQIVHYIQEILNGFGTAHQQQMQILP